MNLKFSSTESDDEWIVEKETKEQQYERSSGTNER
uniref:Uncharacterized protein n=1 Tax=Nelumbo nucifera TaxID=4432 RepID=A0A822YHI8_NELNU|nr:TPA_asm: hypothetical protein HUJ06_009610 [Nelumbo nucifera]